MELQVNQTNIKPRKKTKITTIILGVILVAIPVGVALFINMPELWMKLKDSKGEILKGAVIGFSVLPVLLFIGTKGGSEWYKKIWSWCVLTLMVIGVLLIVFLGKPSSTGADMGMPEGPVQEEGMMSGGLG